MAKIDANIDGLESLMKSLKKDYRVRVGIIGSKASAQHDSKSGLTNADIGAFHEFGTSKMAQRSFLLMPLQEKLPEKIANMKKEIFQSIFVKQSAKVFLDDLGSIARDIIWEYFDNSGFGQWKPLTARTIAGWEKKKGIAGWRTAKRITTFSKGLEKSGERQILSDTLRLRNSISWKVIRNK